MGMHRCHIALLCKRVSTGPDIPEIYLDSFHCVVPVSVFSPDFGSLALHCKVHRGNLGKKDLDLSLHMYSNLASHSLVNGIPACVQWVVVIPPVRWFWQILSKLVALKNIAFALRCSQVPSCPVLSRSCSF